MGVWKDEGRAFVGGGEMKFTYMHVCAERVLVLIFRKDSLTLGFIASIIPAMKRFGDVCPRV